MNKIGLLLPRSVIYPSISFDIVNGLKAGFDDMAVNNIEIKTINIGVGGNYDQIYAHCEQLIFEECKVVVAYINPLAVKKLTQLFRTAGCILIVLDPGYHYASPTIPENIFYLSLQSLLCCRFTADLAVKKGYDKIAYTASFFDAGFSGNYAFDRGIQEAGGSIALHHVTDLSRKNFTLDPVISFIKENPQTGIVASFCGDMMLDFCNALSREPILQQAAVFVSPFAAEEDWLDQIVYCGTDMQTCIAWSRDLENEANDSFKNAMQQKKKAVNVFALLGWEAALFIKQVFAVEDAVNINELLENFVYNSPRGTVRVDALTHHTNAPVYKSIIAKGSNGFCGLTIEEKIDDLGAIRENMLNDHKILNGAGSYWYNAYPCLES